MSKKVKSYNYLLEVSMFGNREEFLLPPGMFMDWCRYLKSQNKQVHFYQWHKLPTIKPT